MERQFQCPSCGAANVVTNPGILMKVCDYCKTAIYWDKESALRIGRKSMDLPSSTRFTVGGSGKIGGRPFRILGRVSYSHENGTWNEWFVELQEDASIMWLTEDEGELFLEKPIRNVRDLPPFEALKPGMQIGINGKMGMVEEVGHSRCIGAEGQIPFQVEIGETYPYADGAGIDGSFSFGLEYDVDGTTPTIFFGKIIPTKGTRSDARMTPETKVGEVIRCVACGKPYEGPKVKTTAMVVCDACGSALELDEAETRVVGKNPDRKPYFAFEIGTPITLDKTRYEVMGRLFYVETQEGIDYGFYEYLLYEPNAGYLWLTEEKGHFVVFRVTHAKISIPPGTARKTKIKVGGDSYKFFEKGDVTLKWVDGALPWMAVVGETTGYEHIVNPPWCLDRETGEKEVELFRGRYVPTDEMRNAVPKNVNLPIPSGVYSCQPFTPSVWAENSLTIGLVFLILNLLLLMYSMAAGNNTPALRERITSEQYSKEHLTGSFSVTHKNTVFKLTGSSPLNNSWLSLSFGVVDASEKVVSEFQSDASYYSGVDSDGSWSEGSPKFTKYFKVEKPGTYKLLFYATGGSGANGPSRNEPVDISLYADSAISWYFIVPLSACVAAVLLKPLNALFFEVRRWSD